MEEYEKQGKHSSGFDKREKTGRHSKTANVHVSRKAPDEDPQAWLDDVEERLAAIADVEYTSAETFKAIELLERGRSIVEYLLDELPQPKHRKQTVPETRTYTLTISTLASNAFIDALEHDPETKSLPWRSITSYGQALSDQLASSGHRTLLKVNRYLTADFLNDERCCFDDDGLNLTLKDDVTKADIIETYCGSIPIEILRAAERIDIEDWL